MLPKLHKHIASWPDFPNQPKVRPVVNDSASLTTKHCRLILPYLQEVERRFPHICLSATHVIHKLNAFTQSHNITNYYITTADVSSMYTNIQTEILIQILQEEKYNLKHKPPLQNYTDKTLVIHLKTHIQSLVFSHWKLWLRPLTKQNSVIVKHQRTLKTKIIKSKLSLQLKSQYKKHVRTLTQIIAFIK